MTSHVTWSRGEHASIIDSLIHYTLAPFTHARRRRVTASTGQQLATTTRPHAERTGDFPRRLCMAAPIRRPQTPRAAVDCPFTTRRPPVTLCKSLPSIRRARKRSNDSQANRFSSGERTGPHARQHGSYSRPDAVRGSFATLRNPISGCFKATGLMRWYRGKGLLSSSI